ncbi:mechanosensitive ion channel family protein [bacterium]|nr:mechanosensitive ion channel family protein [bacterium]
MTTVRFSRWSLILMLVLLAFALPEAIRAQDAPEETETVVQVPAERSSPRATIKTFLTMFNDADDTGNQQSLDKAVATLDLSDIPKGIRNEVGEELAKKLKVGVLDKSGFIVYEDYSDQPDAAPHTILKVPAGEVTIAPDKNGDWKFTKETVASIDRLVEHFRDQDFAEGVQSTENLTLDSSWIQDLMPDVLRNSEFILKGWQWVAMAVLAMIGLLIDRIIVFFLMMLVAPRLERYRIETTQQGRAKLVRPLGLVAMAAFWRFNLPSLELPPQMLNAVYSIIVLIIGCSFILFLLRVVDVIAGHMSNWADKTASKFDDLLVPFVRKSSKIIIVIIGSLTILESLDLRPTSVIASLGLGGLAIALAAKDTVQNVFGSVTIIADRPFQIGDWIVAGDTEGTVESLGFRSTRVRTFYNSLVTIPNAILMNATVDNLGMRRYRRYKTALAITYNTPPERIEAFCEGIREIIREHPYTRKDYYHVYMHTFGAHSLDILVYMFFETPDWSTELRERHRFNIHVMELAERLGVEFAFPTQTLYLERGAGAAKPNDEAFLSREEVTGRLDQGRNTARELVGSTLHKGEVPPPVVINPPRANEPVEKQDHFDGEE